MDDTSAAEVEAFSGRLSPLPKSRAQPRDLNHSCNRIAALNQLPCFAEAPSGVEEAVEGPRHPKAMSWSESYSHFGSGRRETGESSASRQFCRIGSYIFRESHVDLR